MGSSTGAVEAAIHTAHGLATGVGPGTDQGAFARRRVSVRSGGQRELSIRAIRETRDTSPPNAQRGGPPGRPDSELRHRRPEESRSEEAPGVASHPWLTEDQNLSPRRLDTLVQQLLDRPKLPVGLKEVLSDAVSLVRQAEQDISRAKGLLEKCKTAPLNDAQWQELSSLVRHGKQNLPLRRARSNDMLRREAASAGLGPEDNRLLGGLKQRLDDAVEHLFSIDVPWEKRCVRRLETTLPTSPGRRVVVHSRTIPGEVFMARIVPRCPSSDPINLPWLMRCTHVPDLEQTMLARVNGRPLFSGLCHSLIQAEDLDANVLARLSNYEIQTLVRTLLIDDPRTNPIDWGEQIAAELLRETLCSYEKANENAHRMRQGACLHMAAATAAAALVTNPGKLSPALSGIVVDLDLVSIALMTRDDLATWRNQKAAFAYLNRTGHLALQVFDQAGAPLRVAASLRIRQFPLLAEQAEVSALGFVTVQRESVDLLGSEQSPEVGGRIKAAVDDRLARAELSRRRIEHIGQHSALLCRNLGRDHPSAIRRTREIEFLEVRVQHLNKDAQTLLQAGKQLKAMWLPRRGWHTGVDAQLKVASRLALAGHLMGETPLLSCMSGSDLARQVDAETKFLAAAAHGNDGHLPPLDLDVKGWGAARNAFMPQ